MIEQLKSISEQIRKDAIWSIFHAQSGHPGGALSCADILTVLFHRILSKAEKRAGSYSDDYFIMSKGHAAPALYAVMASRDIISRKDLKNLRKVESVLQGHPDVIKTPWAEVSTGSLGQGMSVATGLAKGLKLKCQVDRIFAMIGDGELQEGQVWEAAMFAAHHKLNNLTVILDYNKLQSDALNSEICGLEPLADKWRSFGWTTTEIDGHDLTQIENALLTARENNSDSPSIIIAHTKKGKGVSFMEDIPAWHGSVALTTEQFEESMTELGCDQNEMIAYQNV